MHTKPLSYHPPRWLVERVRLYILSTAWHAELMAEMHRHANARLQAYEVAPERVHWLTVAGSFELVHVAGAIVNRYCWLSHLKTSVDIQGPSRIQTNFRFPPFFQGVLENKLEARFFLEAQGGVRLLQPYEPDKASDLPAIIAMGCILKGATSHYQFLAEAVFHSLAVLNRDSGIPVILGILTPETMRQAKARAPQAADWIAAAYMSWEARFSLPF